MTIEIRDTEYTSKRNIIDISNEQYDFLSWLADNDWLSEDAKIEEIVIEKIETSNDYWA